MTMLRDLMIAGASLTLVLTLWVVVQVGWRRTFGSPGADPDVLAGRMGCGGDCGQHDE